MFLLFYLFFCCFCCCWSVSSHSPIIYASIYTSLRPASWRASTPIHKAKAFFSRERLKKSILIGITDVSKSIVLLDVMFGFYFNLICVIETELNDCSLRKKICYEKMFLQGRLQVDSINDIIFRSKILFHPKKKNLPKNMHIHGKKNPTHPGILPNKR